MAGLAAGAESENPNYEITVSDKAGAFTIGDHDQAKVSAAAAAPPVQRTVPQRNEAAPCAKR